MSTLRSQRVCKHLSRSSKSILAASKLWRVISESGTLLVLTRQEGGIDERSRTVLLSYEPSIYSDCEISAELREECQSLSAPTHHSIKGSPAPDGNSLVPCQLLLWGGIAFNFQLVILLFPCGLCLVGRPCGPCCLDNHCTLLSTRLVRFFGLTTGLLLLCDPATWSLPNQSISPLSVAPSHADVH